MKLLIENGAALEAENNGGATPLMVAAWRRHVDVAKLLIEKGAELESKNYDGATPLMVAASEGHLDVVKLLLEKGASPNVEAKGLTPLKVARDLGYTEIAELLRQASTEHQRRTGPIHDAVTAGDVEKIDALLVD